jgi:molecular chaperone IbpA
MRTFDFTPFSRSTVGFERVFDRLNSMQPSEKADGYPPYDIVRTGDDSFRICLAVAGFSADELAITAQQNLLLVSGRKAQPQADEQEYLYQGISDRAFERRFDLADYIEVSGATYDNGLLRIDLVRRIPEAMKPRRIEIGTGPVPSMRGRQAADPKAA